jgi:hypothetical protein
MARISSRMVSMASQKRSISDSGSLSVGSIISVPGTGKDIVGEWKPKSIRRLATSSSVTPQESLNGRMSMMHSWATRPLRPVYSTGNAPARRLAM